MTRHDQRILGEIAAALSLVWAGTAFADQPSPLGEHGTSSEPNGYEKTPAATSAGSGELVAQIDQPGSAIEWSLTYRNPDDATQSHILAGRPAATGGIVLFLRTGAD